MMGCPVQISFQLIQAVAVCDQFGLLTRPGLVELVGRLQAEDMDSISAALKQILVL
jgi:hypothetical protein